MFSFSAGLWAIWGYFILNTICTFLQLAPSYIITQWVNMGFTRQQEESIYAILLASSTFAFILFGVLRGVFLVHYML